jgi:hypothetical protein
MKRRILILSIAAAATLGAFQWTNQKKTKPRDPNIRTLVGVVQLPDESPAQGAVVKLKNLKNLQIRSFITQTDGKYNFQNLSTNTDYEVRAEFKDMVSQKRTLTIFDTRRDAIMNLRLEPAGHKDPPPDGDATKQ